MALRSGKAFTYDRLNLSIEEIRLVEILPESNPTLIKCNLRHFELRDMPSFRALSYTWGPSSLHQPVSIDGSHLMIRENLHRFLRVLASGHLNKGPRPTWIKWLWIDQICIDQSFVSERNHQVHMMEKIYRRADEVLVWLGDTAFDDPWNFIRNTNRRNFLVKPQSGDYQTAPDKAFLSIVCENPYWHRLWVVQELLLARELVLILGKETLKENELKIFCKSEIGSTYMPSIVQWIAKQRPYTYNIIWTGTSLYDALQNTVDNKCEDPRDKIYGLQSLLFYEQRTNIEYTKSPTQVFLEAAAILCFESIGTEKIVRDISKCMFSLAQSMAVIEDMDELIFTNAILEDLLWIRNSPWYAEPMFMEGHIRRVAARLSRALGWKTVGPDEKVSE